MEIPIKHVALQMVRRIGCSRTFPPKQSYSSLLPGLASVVPSPSGSIIGRMSMLPSSDNPRFKGTPGKRCLLLACRVDPQTKRQPS